MCLIFNLFQLQFYNYSVSILINFVFFLSLFLQFIIPHLSWWCLNTTVRCVRHEKLAIGSCNMNFWHAKFKIVLFLALKSIHWEFDDVNRLGYASRFFISISFLVGRHPSSFLFKPFKCHEYKLAPALSNCNGTATSTPFSHLIVNINSVNWIIHN